MLSDRGRGMRRKQKDGFPISQVEGGATNQERGCKRRKQDACRVLCSDVAVPVHHHHRHHQTVVP